MTDDKIIERLLEAGIDFDRLEETLTAKDNWGDLVHAFEALAVLGVVHGVWRELRT